MNTPKHTPKTAFEKSREALIGWREQQKAILSKEERQKFIKILWERKKEIRQKAKELYDSREQRTIEEKRRLLLQNNKPVLQMFRSKAKSEKLAAKEARQNVRAQDTRTLRQFRKDTFEKADQFLRITGAIREKKGLNMTFQRTAKTKSLKKDWGRGRN